MSNTPLVTNQFGDISLSTINTDMTCIEIHHQICCAKVSLYGGQVLAWQPHEKKPVFWLSKDAVYQQGKAIRGGIPLCWPWFGNFMVAGENVGAHGFARQSQWQLSDYKLVEQGVYLTLTLENKQCHPHWPYAFTLTQTLFFGAEFKQTLMMQNNSEQAFNYSVALHSYFSVSAPENVQIPALTNISFDDKLTTEHSAGETNVSCVGPVDRIYHSTKKMQIIDPKWQRTLNIESDNTQQWVLWNPGKKVAETMADIHLNGENEYVCLEAANTQWQSIAANEQVSISQKISVEISKT
jgi:glucose-6-phosphate 1-epimerase